MLDLKTVNTVHIAQMLVRAIFEWRKNKKCGGSILITMQVLALEFYERVNNAGTHALNDPYSPEALRLAKQISRSAH